MIDSARPLDCDVYRVSDLIDPQTREWNEGLLRYLFDEEDVKAISRIPVGLTNQEDKLVWHPSSNGNYDAKIGYKMIMDNWNPNPSIGTSNQINNGGMNWSSIWELNCVPKIKNFIWKTCHNVVPTCEALAKRHHARSASCNRCGEEEETLEHVVFFCPMSTAIWRASSFHYSPSNVGFSSFAEWWMAMLDMKSMSNDSLNIDLLACTIWGIWKTRNRMIFDGGTKEDPVQVWLSIEEHYNEFISVNGNTGVAITGLEYREDMTGWEPTEADTIKINCDAAFLKSSQTTGIVAVARNSEGVVVGGSNEQTIASNAFVVECLALRLGSKLAYQHGWSKVQIESDCKNAIDMIQGKRKSTWDAEAVINDIREVTGHSSSISFNHVKRNGNRLADWLAKTTLRGTCPRDWTARKPMALYNLIQAN